MRNLVRVAAAGIALATVLLSSPVTAAAAGTMQRVGGAGCWSSGSNTFQCFDEFTGGTAPFTATGSTSNSWASINQITIGHDFAGDRFEVRVQGHCTYGKAFRVTLNVSDSSGQTVTLTRHMSCGPTSEI
ncbi:MAG TPA: hypothetical protein VF557_08925 [Jatrophihabitans sp.]|jgi:hypothetical protein|uniref:hypothetical protein n=1 Tax=Jatrophihabitans sp. TaxID=1932789 RepID=UPI002EE8B510